MRFLQAHYGLRGIALSGFGTEDDIRASSAAGFAEHLTKPVDWPQLRGAIERLLEKKTQDAAGGARFRSADRQTRPKKTRDFYALRCSVAHFEIAARARADKLFLK